MWSVPACMCQNKSSNNCDHWKKHASKRSRNWKKVELNPQLRWLTTVWLCGFDRNVQQLFTVFSLHQYLQRAVMNEWKQLSFSNHHSRVPRWRAFNFAQVPFWCVLGMPSNRTIKAEFKKVLYAKVLIFEKKICSPAGFKPTTSWMQVSCYTNWVIWLWFLMERCSSFLHFFVFGLLQNAIWSPQPDRCSWYVDVGSPRWVISVKDGQTDKRLFSFI